MGIEKIVQYLVRKPREEEIQELLRFDVINSGQAQELREYEVDEHDFELRENQKLALVQLADSKRVFIDDDTGSGKTVIAVKAVQYLEDQLGRPVKFLFFSPNTIKSQWKRRVLSYLPEGYIHPDEIVVIGGENGNGNGYAAIPGARGIIVNYERIAADPTLIQILQEAGFDFVNFDEFQRAKNDKGKTSRNLKKATKGIDYRMATTASPYRKSLKDPANLLAILDPEFYEKEQREERGHNPAYAAEYTNMTDEEKEDLSRFIIGKYIRGEGVPDVGPLRSQYGRVKRHGIRQSTEELTGRKITVNYGAGAYDLSEAEAEIYWRFRNADTQFPDVTLTGTEKLDLLRHVLRDVSVLTPEFVQEKIAEKRDKARKKGNEYSSIYTTLEKIFHAHPEMRNLGQIQSSRYKALENVLQQIPLAEEVVVFTDKKEKVVDKIEGVLNAHYGANTSVQITGDVSTDIGPGRYFSDRELAMLKLQVNEGIKAAVATQQTAGEGIRLDRVRNIILFELPYTWDDIKQMIGRLEGPGQTRDINVYIINEKTRVDQGIINLINYRRRVGDRFLKGTAELTTEEILENLVERTTSEEKDIGPYIQSDLELLLKFMGAMRDKGFRENYRLLQETLIHGEKASKFFARVYESIIENSLPGNMSRLISQVVEGLGGKGKLADLGAGTGFLGRGLAEYELDMKVVNLDINHDALAHGKEKAAEKGLKQGYILSDMGAASLRSGSFDYVVASLSLDKQNLDERVTSLKEAFRIVKHGGYVIIAQKDDYLTTEQKKRYLSGVERLGGRVAEISGSYKGEEGHFEAFIAVAQKIGEPSEDIDPNDFLYSRKEVKGTRGHRKEWGAPSKQRCETFVHEDGKLLQDKIEAYNIEAQKRANETRILGYQVVVLTEQEAQRRYRNQYHKRLTPGTSFINVDNTGGVVYTFQPNADRTRLETAVREHLMTLNKKYGAAR